MLNILYQDDYFVAINKPHGLLVHRSSIAGDVQEFALQLLRNQLKQPVYPVHRLDRKTGGVLLFALDKTTEHALHQQFALKQVVKKYLAIVRGFTADNGEIDYPLKKENGQLQEAFTRYTTLHRAEVDMPLGQHTTSRYSMIEARPTTGRMHQLRRHFAHIHHPIIGDRPHGCNKQNRLFKQTWQMDTMMLHASYLRFEHPVTHNIVEIAATLQDEFKRMMQMMGWPIVESTAHTL